MSTNDVDETLRAVLMEHPTAGFGDVLRQCREVDPVTTLIEWKHSYCKYRSFDGRTIPTHDIETGRPLRRPA